VLTGTGGIADHVDDFLPVIQKETGSLITYDDDPRRLIERCLTAYRNNPPKIRDRKASG
jgi:hypothetical protein